jgi:hypothetical protein
MASRIFDKVMALQKQVIILEGRFDVGASGAATGLKGAGIKSITKESGTGVYSIVLDDQFNRFLGINFTVAHATASGIAKVEMTDVSPDGNVQAGAAIPVVCLDFAGAAANPADGSVVFFTIMLRNSLVKGKGE